MSDLNYGIGNQASLQYIPVTYQTSSYTLTILDTSRMVNMNVASANNLTVPPESSVAFIRGTQIVIAQYGAGQTTVVAGAAYTWLAGNI